VTKKERTEIEIVVERLESIQTHLMPPSVRKNVKAALEELRVLVG